MVKIKIIIADLFQVKVKIIIILLKVMKNLIAFNKSMKRIKIQCKGRNRI